MSTSGPALPVHSLTEARLYLKITACANCGAGPPGIIESATRYDPARHVVGVTTACGRCGAQSQVTFDVTRVERYGPVLGMLGELQEPARQPAAPVINPTRNPSEIIDIPGWLALHAAIAESARLAAARSTSLVHRAAVRRTRIEAGQCLDEALKFYDDENDLPPREGFFTEEGYRRFLEQPELYTRQRLVEMRGRFPR